jgi:hypothetical protein
MFLLPTLLFPVQHIQEIIIIKIMKSFCGVIIPLEASSLLMVTSFCSLVKIPDGDPIAKNFLPAETHPVFGAFHLNGACPWLKELCVLAFLQSPLYTKCRLDGAEVFEFGATAHPKWL